MNTDSEHYFKYAKNRSEKTKVGKNTILAFLCGGAICAFAEGLYNLYMYVGITEIIVKILVPTTLIFIAALLTGIGVFDNIAKVAGAGTLVPITGFANAVVAPAIDTKYEGNVMGIGVKMFKIAGPVIVFGVLASVLYGVIYYIYGVIV